MALNLDPASIAEALRKNVESYTPSVSREEVGRVIESGDGIARVSGLPRTMANELLEFPGGLLGMAFNLDEHEIGCIVFGDAAQIEEGDPVTQTGRILSIPVGDAFLGRVVDGLARPIDDKGPIAADTTRNLEVQAPNVVARQPVKEPLYTGITAIDAMTAIGRGQRQLIIGDRQTGKTAVALDTIISQKQYWGTDQAVKCIYVAIGQKASTVAEVVETLRENGALEYTTVVNAAASDPAPFQYVAPYSGAALGAHWMNAGDAVLIVYDDLSLDRLRVVLGLLQHLHHPGAASELLLRRLVELGAELCERLERAELGEVEAQTAGDLLHRLDLGRTADAGHRHADVDGGAHAREEQLRLEEQLPVGDRDDVRGDVGRDVAALGLDDRQGRHRAAAVGVGELGRALEQPGVQVEHVARVGLAARRTAQ